jgi:large subunit ribosomal protein L5
MKSLENFYFKTIKYDLTNKYLFKETKNIPKIEKIILNFNCWCKPSDFSLLASSILALEMISNQSGVLTKALYPNIALRLRKGFPIGCKLILKKENNFNFLSKVVQEVHPSNKVCVMFKPNPNVHNAFSFSITELFSFIELEKQYSLFKDLKELNITIVTNTQSVQVLEFTLKSLKVPLSIN